MPVRRISPKKKALVTGGCGFLGSHLTQALLEDGWRVTVLDDLSSGSKKNIDHLSTWDHNGRLRLIVGDCAKASDLRRALREAQVVFHMAATPEVRTGLREPSTCFDRNIYGTYALLEQFRRSSAETIVFPSTSSVYGDARLRPTPEDYSPLEPVSLYAASKLSGEALVSSYAHTYERRAVILRFANIVGARSKHGVTADFMRKLKRNPRELKILGDGTQKKSYIHISDCVRAVLRSYEIDEKQVDVYNVASEDQVSVRRIAELVAEEMGLGPVIFSFTGGPDGRGWVGDVKNMLLDTKKLREKNWHPNHGSEDAVRLAVRESIAREIEMPKIVA